ncbi:MAG: hypothetical protein PF692_15190 [Kiritimatiellae bacterium]|nr:hypothetical protein [Kiritimatiellia bacterium]
MTELIVKIKSAGVDVILVTEMQPNPFSPVGVAENWKEYVKAQHEIAEEQDVALADVYEEWMNQKHNGIYPFSMLHNSINHPGVKGHALFAEVILRCLDNKKKEG